MVGRLLFQVPLGRLSDRHGRRWFVCFGLLFLAVTTALLGEVQTLFQFIGLRFLQGSQGLPSSPLGSPTRATWPRRIPTGGTGT
jgi:MFS family permease